MSRRSLIGLGVGLASAGVAAAAGVAADQLLNARRTAVALQPPGELDHVADDTLVVLTQDGVPLHVEIDNPERAQPREDLPTVVLSHGYTLSLKCWVFQRRALTRAGYRVVLWDQRGHGRSGRGEPGSYDIDQLGRDLATVIAQTAPSGPLVLVGHSMGGMTMMAMAAQLPDLVRDRVVGAAFVASSAGSLATVSWDLGAVLGRAVHRVGPTALSTVARRQGLVDAVRRRGVELERFLVARYSFASPVPMPVVAYTADMIMGTALEVTSGFLPSLDRHDKREALAAYQGVEVLVISGIQDMLTPPAHSEEIVRHIPGAEHVLVNDAGHVIMLEHPEVVNEQLLGLLERVRRAGRPGEYLPRVQQTVTDLAQRRLAEAAGSRSRPRRGRRNPRVR